MTRLQSRLRGSSREGEGDEIRLVDPAHPSRGTSTYSAATVSLISEATRHAWEAFDSWRCTSAASRSLVLLDTARGLSANSDRVATDIVVEMGKTIREARAEVALAVASLRYFAGQAMNATGRVLPRSDRSEHIFAERVPLGAVACITPWNFPLLIPTYKVAPAVAFGNTVVLKPAEESPTAALHLADALEAAGLPQGVVNVCLGGPKTGRAVVDAPVAAVSFTGSGEVGRSIARSVAGSPKRTQLEMGGKNAAIVLEDADLLQAATLISEAAMGMAGQRCTATSRVIAVGRAYGELLPPLLGHVRSLRVGDPVAEETDMGPLVSQPQYRKVESAIAAAEHLSTRLSGWDHRDAPPEGYFVPPTLFGDTDPGSPLAQEEVFGPVLALIRASNLEEAVTIANGTDYGLAASVFTSNIRHGMETADRLDAGVVHINGQGPMIERYVPFGGTRGSGQGGREQGEAAREFYTEWKSTYVTW